MSISTFLMRYIKECLIIACIVIGVFLLRMMFASTSSHFSYPAYFQVRQTENILTDAIPISYDELSYGGRHLTINPIYSYILAIFSRVLGIENALKVIPNLFASLLVAVMFLISFEFTKSKAISVLTAFTAGFIPVFFAYTVNNVSIYTLMIPLSFLASYLFIKAHDSQKNRRMFFIVTMFMIFLHPSSWIWLFGFAVYFIICWVEHIKIANWVIESFIAIFFFALVWTTITFRKALSFHGISILWQNIPIAIRATSFTQFNFFMAISLVGIIPFAAAFWVMYKQGYKARNKKIIFMVAQMTSAFLLLWLTFVSFFVGLMFFAVSLLSLFPLFYKSFLEYVKKTKFANYDKFVWAGAILLLVLTSAVPSLVFTALEVRDGITSEMVDAAEFIKENTAPDATIISSLYDSQFIMSHSKRKTFMDDVFLLAPAPDVRFDAVENIYSTSFGTVVLGIIAEYELENVYILHDSSRLEEYWNFELTFTKDRECFMPVFFADPITIYKVECELVEA
jgi:hypothetical protein